MGFHEGDIVDTTVSSITNFGAFVRLDSGEFGLIHISEISEKYVKEVSDVFEKGQRVKCKVIKVENDGKLSLSVKRLQNDVSNNTERIKSNNIPPEYVSFTKSNKTNMCFEDMINKYKKSSEEKISVLKKSVKVRRGNSRKNGR